MKETIINWAIPFICGGLVSFVTLVLVKVKALSEGVKCLLRAEVIKSYEKWSKRAYCPLYAKESLSCIYKAYHSLGGNDVATKLYESVMDLPTEEGDDNE